MLTPICSIGQNDSLTFASKSLCPITVTRSVQIIRVFPYFRAIGRLEIEEAAPIDLGEVIQRVSGATIKSYGGLGGLKTVSFRSLGASNSSVTIDGFPVSNVQVGQTNLSQIQVESVQSVIASKGSTLWGLLPVSTVESGNALLLQTFDNLIGSDTLQVRTSLKMGSFEHLDGFATAKLSVKNAYFSSFGKYRQAKGNYKYEIDNGQATEQRSRRNNEYSDAYYGVSSGFSIKKKVNFRLGYKGKEINQQLPGAVILYNETADESLLTKDHQVFMDSKFNIKSNAFRFFAKGTYNTTSYDDPTYLNLDGFLHSEYENTQLTTGLLYSSGYKGGYVITSGVEQSVNKLNSSGTQFNESPLRIHNYSMLGLDVQFRNWNFKSQLVSQYIEDRLVLSDNVHHFKLSPALGALRTKSGGDKMNRHYFNLRRSFRMPTFNELYYGGIGNASLKPETVDQFNYSYTSETYLYKRDIRITGAIFFNSIENKIVSIPTKNLFVWSMQNVDRVLAYGAELDLDYTRKFHKDSKLIVQLNYTLQRSIDITNRESPTYGHQIAYTPIHTGNLTLSQSFYNFGIRCSNYIISKRYVLNENIDSNIESGFITTDLSLFYHLIMKARTSSKITFQASLKNIFNVQYAYIRSFAMPGTNFIFSINYALN